MYAPIGPEEPGIVITPPIIDVPAWERFDFVCRSADGSPVTVTFRVDGSRVDRDPRFSVSRYNGSAVLVSAVEGLRDIDDTEIE